MPFKSFIHLAAKRSVSDTSAAGSPLSKMVVTSELRKLCFTKWKCFIWVLWSLSSDANAQWLSQTFTLKPGWNAIYTHVDASHVTLDTLLPDPNGPVAEVWLWKPTFSTAQFITSPATNELSNSQWAVWTAARGDTDTLSAFIGNGAFLVNNTTSSSYNWTVKGKVTPPRYQWTSTGLNFIGFPTPANPAPNFSTYLSPAPGLDLAKSLQNMAKIFRYPGGALGPGNPSEVVSFNASTTLVTRGEAFWVSGSSNYYNRYYGPVEVTLQNPSGIIFSDNQGTFTLKLKNLTTSTQTITLNLLTSETPPSGQEANVGTPELLVRGSINPSTLIYDHTILSTNSFALTPQGQVGSELQIILGLNRSKMIAPAGSLYSGILRITDNLAMQQVDLPVTARSASASGLWVGQASINQVGQYLKSFPKVDSTQADQTAQINAAAAQANQPPSGVEIPGAQWVGRETNVSRAYSSVASSLDSRTILATVNGGPLYVSSDYGTTWTARDSNRSWAEAASSADGTILAAAVFNGAIYISTNSGANWAPSSSGNQAWIGLACSDTGNLLSAVAQNGSLYTSSNRGATWVTRSNAGLRNWSSITMSSDGTRLAATVNPGQIFTSQDSGVTWRTNASSLAWTSIASSADGIQLIASVANGLLYISTDAGMTWGTRATSANWTSVTSSTDGKRLAALVKNGQIFTSDDFGGNWVAREQTRNWDDLATSGDATRLVGVVNGGSIYTLNRAFASYTVDTTTGLVQDRNGLYLSSGVNTNMAKVGNVFPLRLILHNRSESNKVNLLQRAYLGQGISSTNTIVATRESSLDPTQLASARRISATHLPFSLENVCWEAAGTFNPGSVILFTVTESYKDHASNPFLHTFNPNHDNLDANFKTVLPRGVESYDITRSVMLTFKSPGTDFSSLTANAQSREGTYQETMAISAEGGSTRNFQSSGTFQLQLISPVATLTK